MTCDWFNKFKQTNKIMICNLLSIYCYEKFLTYQSLCNNYGENNTFVIQQQYEHISHCDNLISFFSSFWNVAKENTSPSNSLPKNFE